MYKHPGQLFIQRHGDVEDAEDVMCYASFLREESGLNTEPPVDLSRIYSQFHIPTPKRVPLQNQQGMVVNSDLGIIFINNGDIETRQRFTEAHELMELLFAALPNRRGAILGQAPRFKYHIKERLCNEGAAELIMPRSTFLPRLHRLHASYETGRSLAYEFGVSTSAALIHMIRIGPGHHAIVLWRMKNKPSEISNIISSAQLGFFADHSPTLPPKKLRVEWVFTGRSVSYIPLEKSVPEDSSVFTAWQTGTFTTGKDRLQLASVPGLFRCENQPFETDTERLILSFLHCPGDTDCGF